MEIGAIMEQMKAQQADTLKLKKAESEHNFEMQKILMQSNVDKSLDKRGQYPFLVFCDNIAFFYHRYFQCLESHVSFYRMFLFT